MEILWRFCVEVMEIVCSFHEDSVKILCRLCGGIVEISWRFRPREVVEIM